MAERIPGFTVSRHASAFVRYPWKKWMDGSVWRVKQGVDFYVTRGSFRVGLYGQAKRSMGENGGYRIVSRFVGLKEMEFQFIRVDAEGNDVETEQSPSNNVAGGCNHSDYAHGNSTPVNATTATLEPSIPRAISHPRPFYILRDSIVRAVAKRAELRRSCVDLF